MGLDISAYKGIKKLDAVLDDGGYAINPKTREEITESNWFSTWLNPDFPGRADDIEDGCVYSYQDCTGHGIGYGGHFWWREELSKLAGYPLADLDMSHGKEKNHFGGAIHSSGGAFYELINFSDAEGIIGTAVSQKLASDFAEFEDLAKEVGGRFFETYQRWKEAFEMASDGGCVRFH